MIEIKYIEKVVCVKIIVRMLWFSLSEMNSNSSDRFVMILGIISGV